MIQQGLIEKVIVPNKTSVASVKCLRLLDGNSTSLGEGATIVLDHDGNSDDEEIGKTMHSHFARNVHMISLAQLPGIKFNATIHKQIIDLIEESGTRGMTLSVSP